ncbi:MULTISPECIES: SRPBCC family protein [Acidobacteriaceae]|uniref:SRPBCC family protein n=1 Tax=Acidobacteriaceae TaxID=204434 RepID=UPI00131E63E9|nr:MULTISPECIES: SRPBCC family protein [Acidobacteriaceae]MDW5265632.1 SRPBCC family protein [Edaphobacter sp.]
MFVVSDRIHVNAPIERCFLLSTNLELVKHSLRMKLVPHQSSRAGGLVESGDRLMWQGWAFGLPHQHESLITRYERPDFFQDTMERGRFKRFQHDHFFAEIGGRTLLSDKVRFSLPLGGVTRPLGRFLVTPYVSKLLRHRLELLKRVAESDEWKQYLPG